MSKPEFDPFDPVSAAMGALHQGNLLAANEAQIANLKAELTNCKSEADRLKAEVEHLTEGLNAQGTRLLALSFEVERLREAGDAMAEAMWYGDAERSIWVKKFAETAWNAAKEGKQP